MSADVPPSRLRRFFRSWWTRGLLAFTAFAVGSHYYSNWKWERRWQEYVAEKRARGEKVYIAEYLPQKPIPDDQNFAATPFWNEVFAQNGKGPRARKFDILQRGHSRVKNLSRPVPIDLAAYREGFEKAGKLGKADAALSDGEAVLKGLKHLEPEISEISAAIERPFAVFPTDWENGFAAKFTHLQFFQAFGKALSLRAVASIAVGRGDDALSDILLATALSEKLNETPSMIQYLVAVSVVGQALKSVDEGLNKKAWSPSDLLKLEKALARINHLELSVRSLQVESAVCNVAMELHARSGKVENVLLVAGLSGQGEDWLVALYAKKMSFWRENQIWMARARDEDVTMFDFRAERWTPKNRMYVAENITGFFAKAELAIAGNASSGFQDVWTQNVLFSHSRVRMAGLACALERYRIAKGGYPEKLDALLPDFLQKLPHDPCDGKPFRYRLSDGGYLLYSIGMDLSDDGGNVKDVREEQSGPDWRWWSPLPKSP